MLHVTRTVLTRQIQCDQPRRCISFRSRVIANKLFVTCDDVTWPLQVTSSPVQVYPRSPMSSCPCPVGLCKKHQLWKLKASRVVSHAFEHAELDGARKNQFHPLLGVAKIIWNFWKWMEAEKSKCKNNAKMGPKICEMMRGFQIWPQNSNPIIFDPFLGQKTVQKWQTTRYSVFLTVFWEQRGHILSDLNYEAKFRILSSFRIF